MDTIFTITTLGHLGTKQCERTVGWWPTLPEAKEVVIHNWGDIHETCYDHVVIEEISLGLYPLSKNEYWFRWKDNKYVESTKPVEFIGLCNWAIG